MTLSLRSTVRHAHVGDDIILLDIAANRYFAVPPSMADSFRRMFDRCRLASFDYQNLAPYLERGIIVEGDLPTPAPPAKIENLTTLDLSDTTPTARIRMLAISERCRARFELSTSSFSAVLARITRLKRKSGNGGSISDARQVASAFMDTFGLFARHDQCLPFSLALARVCLRNELAAQLVLGVQTNPFNAHAWVQLDQLLLDDDPEFVKDFTPILVV